MNVVTRSRDSWLLETLGPWRELFPLGIPQTLIRFFANASSADVVWLAAFSGLAVGVLALVLLSQGALLHGCARILESRKIPFSDATRAGGHHFWSVLQTLFLGKIIFWSVLLVFGLPLLIATPETIAGGNVLSVLLFFVLGIPILMAISVIIRFSLISIVTEDQSVWAAGKKSCVLLARNWLACLELILLMFVVDLALFLVVLIGQFMLVIPFGFLAVLFLVIGTLLGAGGSFAPILFVVLWMLGVLLYTLLVLGYGVTLQTMVWVSFYTHCAEGRFRSFLRRCEERARTAFQSSS